MSTYAIGDIQGCFNPFMELLNKVQFNPAKDFLWLTGDLVNRGPHSLETLRFVKGLKNRAITVLGNHDFALLAVGLGAIPYQPDKHTFQDVLQAEDKQELLDWLRSCPLLHFDAKLGYAMIHAGLYPQWDLTLASSLANEVETALQGSSAPSLLKAQYENKRDHWDPQLTGLERLSFIIDCFTRIRFCSLDGTLEFETKTAQHEDKTNTIPWFMHPNFKHLDFNILFGHWAALQGNCPVTNIFALDTGCVWGNCLTALRLEDGERFTIPCP